MIQFKLALREGALDEASFTVAKLSVRIVTPEKKGAVVQRCHAVSLATGDVSDVKRGLLGVQTVIHFGEVLHQRPIIQVGGSIDAQLALQVVTAGVDQFVRALTLTVTHLADHDGVLLTAGRIDHEFVQELTAELLRRKDGVRGTIRVLVVIRVRQLLHTVETPAVEAALLGNCEAVSITRDYLDDLLWNWHFLGSSMPNFEERSDLLPVFLALATLAKCIIAHGPHLPFTIEHDDVIDPCANHFKRWQILDENRLVNEQLPSVLRSRDVAKHLIFTTRRLLLNPEDVELAVLGDDEHSLACEGHLLYFSVPWQRCHLDQRVSHAIRHLLNLY